jgi:ribosomal-protein-alanine N-acetyltransferase
MEFSLREWHPEDRRYLEIYAGNAAVASNLRDGFPNPFTPEAAEKFIETARTADPAKVLMRAVDVGGKAVGSIGVFRQEDIYRKSADIAYWLGEPFWGKGIMTEAVMQMCRLAFERLDIVRIQAEPFARNTGSCRVLEKAGFVLEGIHKKRVFKNGDLGDSCSYALVI